MGILDIFDSPDALGAILGINSANGATMPAPPPQMAPTSPPRYASQTANSFGATAPGAGPGAPPAGPVPSPASFPDPTPKPIAIGSDYAASGGQGGDIPWGVPGQSANVPLPPPRPPSPPPAAPPAAPPPAAPPANAAFASAAPPMPPAAVMNPANAPVTQSNGGGLAGSLGIDPARMKNIVGALGKGLTATSQMKPGSFGATNFAAGLGGAIQGGQERSDKTLEQQRQLKNDLFNRSSTAFKDVLAEEESGDKRALNAAHSQYFAARAAQMQAGGGTGSNAWQNSPYGKTIGVENEAQKFEKGQQIILQKQWTLNGATPDQQKDDLKQLQQKVDDFRTRLYKQAGVDPKQAEKLKTMGMSQGNPFDTKGMTIEQFHQQVPMGGWFKDQNGVVRQRTVAPPGTNPSARPTVADDQLALQPAQ